MFWQFWYVPFFTFYGICLIEIKARISIDNDSYEFVPSIVNVTDALHMDLILKLSWFIWVRYETSIQDGTYKNCNFFRETKVWLVSNN